MSTTRTFEQGKAVLMACIMTAAIIVSNSVAAFETSGQGSPESIEYCSIIKDPRLTNEEKVRLDEVTKAYELSVNCWESKLRYTYRGHVIDDKIFMGLIMALFDTVKEDELYKSKKSLNAMYKSFPFLKKWLETWNVSATFSSEMPPVFRFQDTEISAIEFHAFSEAIKYAHKFAFDMKETKESVMLSLKSKYFSSLPPILNEKTSSEWAKKWNEFLKNTYSSLSPKLKGKALSMSAKEWNEFLKNSYSSLNMEDDSADGMCFNGNTEGNHDRLRTWEINPFFPEFYFACNPDNETVVFYVVTKSVSIDVKISPFGDPKNDSVKGEISNVKILSKSQFLATMRKYWIKSSFKTLKTTKY